MTPKPTRIEREKHTIVVMITLYCQAHHSQDGLCPECAGLLAYADKRLDKCTFQEGKTTCARCPVHCYPPEMREKIRRVMRYSGPRMLYRHPIMTLRHWMDNRRKAPLHPNS